jgi:hypothetical protein
MDRGELNCTRSRRLIHLLDQVNIKIMDIKLTWKMYWTRNISVLYILEPRMTNLQLLFSILDQIGSPLLRLSAIIVIQKFMISRNHIQLCKLAQRNLSRSMVVLTLLVLYGMIQFAWAKKSHLLCIFLNSLILYSKSNVSIISSSWP